MIENMQYAINQVKVKKDHKLLFITLLCGGANTCENLKLTGVNALCVSWGQNNEKPNLAKIIPILDSLILKSEILKNPVVICFELVTNQRTSMNNNYYCDYFILFFVVPL